MEPMERLTQWWEEHSLSAMLWLVAWPLLLALLVVRFVWSGLEPALKVLQQDAWRRTLEANKAYEEWSAEELETRFRNQREQEAKMKAVLDRIKTRHAENLSKLAQYRIQRQAAIDLMKDEAARIRAKWSLPEEVIASATPPETNAAPDPAPAA